MFDFGQARSELLDRPLMVVSQAGADSEPARSILPALKPKVQVQFVGDLEQAREKLGLSARSGESSRYSRIRPSALIVCDSIGDEAARQLIEGVQQSPDLRMTPVLVLSCSEASEGSLASEDRHPHCRVLNTGPDAAAVRQGLADLGMAWLVGDEAQVARAGERPY